MQTVRVLLADDSMTARTMMRSILESEDHIRIVGEAKNGVEAVEMTRELQPDIVLMDVHMPVMDGIDATKEIMARAPTPILIVSAATQRDVDLSLSATQAGALLALPKPDSPTSPRFEEQRAELVAMVRALSQVKVVRRWVDERRARPRAGRARASGRIQVIAIAASTGGPAALRTVLMGLPSRVGVPIVIVQHIARDFTAGFARWLGDGLPLPVKLAGRDEPMEPGVVYVAPDNTHTGVTADRTICFSGEGPIGGFRPSATYLFASAARAFGADALGVVLTGMGSDGVQGLLELKRAGGYVIGQDEPSSVVYGMAQEAARVGAIDEMLPLDRIAPRLVELVREGRGR